jgi:glutamate dehydrogenase
LPVPWGLAILRLQVSLVMEYTMDLKQLKKQFSSEFSDSYKKQYDLKVKDFLSLLPQNYFLENTSEQIHSHLRGLLAIQDSGVRQEISLGSPESNSLTVIHNYSCSGQLHNLVSNFSNNKKLKSAKIYTAHDSSFIIDAFEFENESNSLPVEEFVFSKSMSESSKAFFENMDLNTIKDFGCLTQVQYLRNPEPLSKILLAVSENDMSAIFEKISAYLTYKKLDIHSVQLFKTSFGETQFCCVELEIRGVEFDSKSEFELARICNLDKEIASLCIQIPSLELIDYEMINVFNNVIYQVLCFEGGKIYTKSMILDVLIKHIDWVKKSLWTLKDKFDEKNTGVFEERLKLIDNPNEKYVLETLERFCSSILKTNMFFENRNAISFRLDPVLFHNSEVEQSKIPFGVFYIVGNNFDAFHIRFRDIARGGMRIIRTRSDAQFMLESESVYKENWSLAFAQQLKNKDIPEGGAKGVILTKPNVDYQKCGKLYVDGLLDLIVEYPNNIDFNQQTETIFLGPDENVSPELIEWVIRYSNDKGYAFASAFMTSKPNTGINHKQYGVTSEGVIVFLEQVRKYLELDKKDSFSVKLTGGPDGDVAGNCLKILYREYGEKCRVVGVADGFGGAEDNLGLDWKELLRLVETSKSIVEFDVSQLNSGAEVYDCRFSDGMEKRSSMHNRIQSDFFIPAGGRPETINESNWQLFLNQQGVLSSKAIIEGANLYLTSTARDLLGRAGCLIFKDSSANKCGVITSSLEICANILLTEIEFLEIKADYVEEVLAKLKNLALAEVRLLLKEFSKSNRLSLPELSLEISNAIILLSDQLIPICAKEIEKNPKRVHVILEKALPTLLYSKTKGDVLARLPKPYLLSVMSNWLASSIIYKLGSSTENDFIYHHTTKSIEDFLVELLSV